MLWGGGRWTWTPSTDDPPGPTPGRPGALAAGERCSPAAPGCSPSRSRTPPALVDLTALGWPALDGAPPTGLSIAATCTIAELRRLPAEPGWAAQPCSASACTALLASFKIWNVATVGGNICLALPAGADDLAGRRAGREALVWTRPDGERPRLPVRRLRHRRRATTALRPARCCAPSTFRRRALAAPHRVPQDRPDRRSAGPARC